MIGQTNLLENINIMTTLPRFNIIIGQKGQGKKTIARWIAKRFDYSFTFIDTKIDDIRYMIETAYKQANPIIYIIADADDMSLGAKNSLLKIIEEPPQNAYFIMTLQQLENTLETIKSRANIIRMQDYTYNEKMEMIRELAHQATLEEKQILNKLDNYWQIKQVLKYNVIDFYNYVEKVYNNIYKVQGANSFKLAEKLDIKDDDNGYNIELFFIMYIYCCMEDLIETQDDNMISILSHCISATYIYKGLLSLKSINRQMLIDMWIVRIREVWQNDKNRN